MAMTFAARKRLRRPKLLRAILSNPRVYLGSAWAHHVQKERPANAGLSFWIWRPQGATTVGHLYAGPSTSHDSPEKSYEINTDEYSGGTATRHLRQPQSARRAYSLGLNSGYLCGNHPATDSVAQCPLFPIADAQMGEINRF